MTTHEKNKQQLLKNLNALFSDTSVSKETVKESLLEIKEEIELLLDALDQ